MSPTPKAPPTPHLEDDAPIGDIEDMTPERVAPLGDFDDDEDEGSPLDFDLGTFVETEPLRGLLDKDSHRGERKPATSDNADRRSRPQEDARSSREEREEDLPSLDEALGYEEEKKDEPEPGADGDGPESDVPLDLETDLHDEEIADSDVQELTHDEAALQFDMATAEEDADPEGRPSVDAPVSLLLDTTFLGPHEGHGCAAAFPGGKPVVVGDGMFVLAADGLLHETAGSARLAVAEANSLLVYKRTIYIGSEHGGLFATRDMGQSFEQLNRWVNQGLAPGAANGLGSVPTSLTIAGHEHQGRLRLLGLTGEGQLLSTFTPEQGWSGPYSLGRCLTLCPVHGTSHILLVTTSADARPRLLATPDFDHIEARELPPGVAAAIGAAAPLHLSASASTVLCGADREGEVAHLSDDGGCTWRALSHLGRPTSVLVDPDNPSWLAVASWRGRHAMGAVHVSSDAGVSWSTVLVTGEATVLRDDPFPEAHRIGHLSLHLGRTRRLLVVTAAGTHLVALAEQSSPH